MRLAHFGNADLAHLVERNLAKVEVAGSSPVIRLFNYSDVRKYIAFFALGWKNKKRPAMQVGKEYKIKVTLDRIFLHKHDQGSLIYLGI